MYGEMYGKRIRNVWERREKGLMGKAWEADQQLYAVIRAVPPLIVYPHFGGLVWRIR